MISRKQILKIEGKRAIQMRAINPTTTAKVEPYSDLLGQILISSRTSYALEWHNLS